jgi:hypothetical protein
MKWISQQHAVLVADYERTQAATEANIWPDRPDAPYRLAVFATGSAEADEQD